MHDIRLIREQSDSLNRAIQRRSGDYSFNDILALDIKRRELLQEEETLRSERNVLNKQIGELRKAGENADEIQAKSKAMGERIKAIESEKTDLEDRQNALLLDIPNTPSDKAPDGKSDADNVEVRRWGDEFLTRPCCDSAHWDIGPEFGMIDFERGVKVAQSRFTLLRNDAAKLTRALIALMLDTHTENGYEELAPPYLVNAAAMTGTGQLPKFEEDMFRCRDDELYLIPTAEVPVTNLYADEELAEENLPMCFAAYTPCFRREAGSAGKDTRGLIRQHQFDKVELVKLAHPDNAEEEHEKLLADAERILQILELPYRVVDLCTGDLGFSAKRCYDIEVWLPGQQQYREISSCSHFGDFQARRAGLKFRPADGGKLQFVHTINGSGLAVGRTLVAILENYRTSEDTITVPAALQPYMKKSTIQRPTPQVEKVHVGAS